MRKPLTCMSSGSRPHNTTTSAIDPLPIQRFAPLITYSSPSSRPRLHGSRFRAVRRLGQRERTKLLATCHRRQPALLLLLGAMHVDRPHGQTALYSAERAHAAVPAVELHGDQTRGGRAHRRTAVALQAITDQAQLTHPPVQLDGHLGAFPVAVDHG